MKRFKITFTVLIFLLTVAILVPVNKKENIKLNAEENTLKRELKAVWVTPLVGDVNLNGEQTFKNSMTGVLDVMDFYGLNALMFHVRIHNNALYPSEINPKATYVSNINFNTFDPIEWLIAESHKRGIEFHAWMNPYRVSATSQASPMPLANPQSDINNLIIEGDKRILNPDKQVVRNHIYNTIEEFATLYPTVDAIHFDDYFYIQTNVPPTSPATKRENIDLLIEGISDVLTNFNETNNKAIQFGISPTGIYKNGNGDVSYDYNGNPITNGSNTGGQEHYASYLFADTVKWAVNEWIDYLAPQVYWARNHSVASFTKVIDWWDKVFKYLNVNLYSGIGVYMADELSNTYDWKINMNEMNSQLTMLSEKENVQGYAIFSYKHLYNGYSNSSLKSGQQIRNAYQTEDRRAIRVLPEIKTMTPVIPEAVTNVVHSSGILTWDAVSDAKFYYIYKSSDELTYSSDEIVGVTGNGITSFTTNDYTDSYNYGLKALSITNHLSGAQSETPVETYNITYNLNGGKLPGYNNKEEMIEAFLSDLYDFINPVEDLTTFMHGVGKTSGFDGLFYSNADYNNKIYAVNIKSGNNNYFLSSYLYQDKWQPFADFMDDMIREKNATQSFWGSTYEGNLRLHQYITGKAPWTSEELEMMPEGLTPTAINSYNKNMSVILPVPEKEGFEFYGWYTNVNFYGEPIAIIEIGTTGDFELFARFSLPLAAYKVEYDLNYNNLSLPTVYVTEGDFVPSPEVPFRYLYQFLGWKVLGETELFNFNTIINSDIKLVAQWEELEAVTVSFNLNYPLAINPSDVILGKGTKLAKPTDPVRENYAFVGWYLNDSLYDFNLPVTTNITLTAKWNDPTFSITFDLKGGYLNALDLIEYANNTKIVATRYSNGIYDGTHITIGYARPGIYWYVMAFKDTEVEGVYELVNKGYGYTNENATLYISYHGEVSGSYANTLKTIYENITAGSLVVVNELPANLSIVNEVEVNMYFLDDEMPEEIVVSANEITELLLPFKALKVFGGWYLNSSFTGSKVTTLPPLTGDLTLYAKWEEETVEVTFDLNYEGAPPASKVTISLNSKVIKPVDPERIGYLFLGWYLPLETLAYDFESLVTADLILKAKWQENTETTLVTATDGASIRFNGIQGLRFYASLNSSVKNKEHGFYLIYGSITINELKTLIANEINLYNGKEIIKVSVPSVKNITNEYSVVLTGIPLKGYLDKISVVPYVKVDGEIILADDVVSRSVGEVAVKAIDNGEPIEQIIEDINNNLFAGKIKNQQFIIENATLYETDPANLRVIFCADWNSFFGTNFTNPTASQFYTNARVGSTGEAAGNTNLKDSNIYKFFNHPFYQDKWGWLLDFLENVDYTIHATSQIRAIKGDGTYYNTELNRNSLYNANHLSYSIYNFFNKAFEKGGYPTIDFTDLSRYEQVLNYNNEIMQTEINVYDYYLKDAVIKLPVISLTPNFGKVYQYYDLVNYYNPGDNFIVKEVTLEIVETDE